MQGQARKISGGENCFAKGRGKRHTHQAKETAIPVTGLCAPAPNHVRRDRPVCLPGMRSVRVLRTGQALVPELRFGNEAGALFDLMRLDIFVLKLFCLADVRDSRNQPRTASR
jgi:hypothetical protein